MKKQLLYIIILLATSIAFSSCDEDDTTEIDLPQRVRFVDESDLNITVSPGSDEEVYSISVFSDEAISSPIKVWYEIIEDTAFEGEDFNIVSNREYITIPPGEKEGKLLIAPVYATNSMLFEKRFQVKLVSTSYSERPVRLRSTGEEVFKTVVLENTGCVAEFSGSYEVTTTVAFEGDGNGGQADEVEVDDTSVSISLIDCDDTSSTYRVDDITFGMYTSAYNAPGNPGVILLSGNSITIVESESPDVVYGSDFFSGEGSVNEVTGEVNITWFNVNYGDYGEVTFNIN